MMCGKPSDIFWYDYKKAGYTESDFEDNVVTDAKWEEVDTSVIQLRDRNGEVMSSGAKNVLDTIMKIGCDLAVGGVKEII